MGNELERRPKRKLGSVTAEQYMSVCPPLGVSLRGKQDTECERCKRYEAVVWIETTYRVSTLSASIQIEGNATYLFRW